MTFDDGTSAEFDSKLNTKTAGMRSVGSVVPVRCDVGDRSKIDIDYYAWLDGNPPPPR